jgi:hypothetical protein
MNPPNRDANAKTEAKEESQARRDDYNKKAKALKESQKMLYTGDMVDVLVMEGAYRYLNMKSSRKGEILSVAQVQNLVADGKGT